MERLDSNRSEKRINSLNMQIILPFTKFTFSKAKGQESQGSNCNEYNRELFRSGKCRNTFRS